MDALLGIGGEAIVIDHQNQAFKIIPLDGADEQMKRMIRRGHARIRKIQKMKNVPIQDYNLRSRKRSIQKEKAAAKRARVFEKRANCSYNLRSKKKAPMVATPVQTAPPSEQEKADFKVAETNLETTKVLKDKSEFECSSIRHKNVINYENVTLDIVNGFVAMIIGKFIYTKRKLIILLQETSTPKMFFTPICLIIFSTEIFYC